MTKKNKLPLITLILTVTINITTLLNGVKHHESYQVVLGGIGVGLMAIVITANLVRNYRQKRKGAL